MSRTNKKTSLAAALQTHDRSATALAPVVARQPEKPTPVSVRPPSRVAKKTLIGYFDPSVVKQLKQMALDHDSTNQALLCEALNDLFQKYNKPAIAS